MGGERTRPAQNPFSARASLTEDDGLGGADCILHMEARGTGSATGVGDVSLDF